MRGTVFIVLGKLFMVHSSMVNIVNMDNIVNGLMS